MVVAANADALSDRQRVITASDSVIDHMRSSIASVPILLMTVSPHDWEVSSRDSVVDHCPKPLDIDARQVAIALVLGHESALRV